MRIRVLHPVFWTCSILAVAALACQPGPGASPSATPPAENTPIPIAPSAAVDPEQPSQSGLAPVDLPAKRADQASDINSSVDATKRIVPGGDAFTHGLYERPFNANTMDTYFPYFDIVQIQGFKDDTWGYATITLDGTDANGQLPGKYGVELDLNNDGRGDWLILASSPSSTDWTTQGVQAWKDTDGDVGGTSPLAADPSPSNGDGYETLVFDQGHKDPVDGAWVRITAADKKTVQLAFKLSMIGDPKFYALEAWAGSSDILNPAMFDFNDRMTHAQAGSPLPSYEVYPLKQLAEVDNTCRLAIGFAPTGAQPGLCSVPTVRNKPDSGAANAPGAGAPPPPPPPPPVP